MQGNAYGPQLRSKGMTTCLTLAGIVTCVIHLVFPIISGTLIVLAGLQIDSSLSGFTHTVTEQVRASYTAVRARVSAACVVVRNASRTLSSGPATSAQTTLRRAHNGFVTWLRRHTVS